MSAAEKGTRTCTMCRAQAYKGALLRIVRCADGSVAFDPTGRMPGRGAYVCSLKCFEDAFSSRKLQRALRTDVSKDDVCRIASDIAEVHMRGDER